MMIRIWLFLCCLGTVFAGDFVIPWVAEQPGVYTSILVINNHANIPLDFSLIAVKMDGQSNTQNRTIDAFGHFRQSNIGNIFNLSGGMSIHIHTTPQ